MRKEYNYAITLAGDPFFDGEQPANISGTACVEQEGHTLGTVDLSKLPGGYILHHQRLETVDNEGVRKIARLRYEGCTIKINSDTLNLKTL